jgi:hypothetical protein
MRPWYVALWVLSVLALLGLFAYGATPTQWSTAFVVLFLVPELVGLRTESDALPPLTHVVRLWSPRWLTYAATGALGAWMAVAWFEVAVHPLIVEVIISGMVFWLVEHWREAYDAWAKVQQGDEIKLWPTNALPA